MIPGTRRPEDKWQSANAKCQGVRHMKRVMPSTAVSNTRLETILSLRQRLALLQQLERKLK